MTVKMPPIIAKALINSKESLLPLCESHPILFAIIYL